MNGKALKFVQDFSATLLSNLISLIVSTIVVLIVPKLVGVEEYGYWQIYLFYSIYVGFLHFGWSDGIYLRYGGYNYPDLNKRLFFSQFYMLLIMQLIIAVVLSIATVVFLEGERVFIFFMVIINLIIVNMLSILLLTLQATNRIMESSYITIISRVFYIVLIIIFLLVGIRDYQLLIVSDLIGKLISLLFAVYICRDIVFCKLSSFYLSFSEALENIIVGIALMFANIASMLIIGVVRFGIERSWDVSTFGKVSLTMGISNLLMLFINAIGVILFPILKRTNEKEYSQIYITVKDILMALLFGVLLIYFPMKPILHYWIPKYSESLMYMAILFPICVFEGKIALLVNTFFKSLRKEKVILRINIIVLILAVILTIITTILFKQLHLALFSIVLLLAIRSIIAEWFLSNLISIPIIRDVFFELGMALIFISVGWFIENSVISFVLYLSSFIVYLSLKKKSLVLAIQRLRAAMLIK